MYIWHKSIIMLWFVHLKCFFTYDIHVKFSPHCYAYLLYINRWRLKKDNAGFVARFRKCIFLIGCTFDAKENKFIFLWITYIFKRPLSLLNLLSLRTVNGEPKLTSWQIARPIVILKVVLFIHSTETELHS